MSSIVSAGRLNPLGAITGVMPDARTGAAPGGATGNTTAAERRIAGEAAFAVTEVVSSVEESRTAVRETTRGRLMLAP